MSRSRVLLVILGLVAVAFALGALLVPLLNREEVRATDLAGPAVTHVEVSSERGAVRVEAGAARVEERRSWILSAPEVTPSLGDDGVLRVDVSCPGWAFVSCSADVVVRVPADAAVNVRAVEGDVTVQGMAGDTDARSEDGAVSVTGARSQTIVARSITRPVSVTAATAPARVDARSETHGVTVRVPPGAYRIEADSGRGTARVEGLRDDPDSPRLVRASSGGADAAVLAAG